MQFSPLNVSLAVIELWRTIRQKGLTLLLEVVLLIPVEWIRSNLDILKDVVIGLSHHIRNLVDLRGASGQIVETLMSGDLSNLISASPFLQNFVLVQVLSGSFNLTGHGTLEAFLVQVHHLGELVDHRVAALNIARG